MIELLATAPDGWAIAQEEDQRWLVRPPYGQAERFPLRGQRGELMLADEDFVEEPTPRAFRGWGELCRYLQDIRVQTASMEERLAARDAALRLLTFATAAQAKGHLDKIRARLDASRPTGVDQALHALLGATAVQDDRRLVAEIHELLEHARRLRPRPRSLSVRQREWPVDDEAAADEENRMIQGRHSMLLSA